MSKTGGLGAGGDKPLPREMEQGRREITESNTPWAKGPANLLYFIMFYLLLTAVRRYLLYFVINPASGIDLYCFNCV